MVTWPTDRGAGHRLHARGQIGCPNRLQAKDLDEAKYGPEQYTT